MTEGFNVSTDVISRVLKSKFVPTLELKLKQDQKVLKKTGVAHLLQQLQGSGNTSKLLPAGHSVSGSLLMPGHEASSKDPNHTIALKVIESNTHRTNVRRRWKGRNNGSQNLEKESYVPLAAALGHQRELQKYSSASESTRRTDDGRLPSDQKLEKLKAGEPGRFSSKVVRRREFFDRNRNFLYGI